MLVNKLQIHISKMIWRISGPWNTSFGVGLLVDCYIGVTHEITWAGEKYNFGVRVESTFKIEV